MEPVTTSKGRVWAGLGCPKYRVIYLGKSGLNEFAEFRQQEA